MKKPISFSLVLGMIFLPSLSILGQKPMLHGIDRLNDERKLSLKKGPIATSDEFASIRALTSGRQVLLEWQMRSEKGNMGFYVHRIDHKGERVVNAQIVFGSAARAGRQPIYGEQYSFLDTSGGFGSVYYLETIDLDGKRAVSGTVAPRYSKSFIGKAPGVPTSSDVPGKTEGSSFQTEELSLTKEIVSQIETQPSIPDPAKHKWVISHPGARIDVKTEGIYRVTFAQLQSPTFDTNSDKSLWQLYRNGLEQAFTVNEAESYIEFYGRGIDTTESDIQGYFLIVGDTPGKRIENAVARPSTSTISLRNYNQTSSYKERLNYLNTILNGTAENYWGRAINSAGTNVNFDLSGIDFNSPTATLEVKAQGFSGGTHSIRITLNGQLLDPIGGIAQFPVTGSQTVPTSLLKDASLGQGSNVLNVASVGPSGDFNLFDSVNVSFARKHLANQGTLKAYTVNNKRTQISGFTTPNVRVFDITFENDPRVITNLPFQDQGGTFGAELPATRGRVFFAVDDSKLQSPFAVNSSDGEILGSNSQGANLIIIAYKDFLTEAQAWADYRSTQGVSVKVVNIDEIYNEFNYGNLSSDSIESFLQYAYNNWSIQPQYVLLLGDASYDSRNYQGIGFFNFVPTRIVTTSFTETGSDDSLADFNNDGLAEIAIGRVPARVPSEIDTVFQKVTNWEANLLSSPLGRGTLFAVDQFDSQNAIDFPAISDRIKGELPAGTASTTVIRGQPNAQTDLLTAMDTGKYIVNYTGHGAAGTWSSTSYFWNGNVASLTNHNTESIYTMLTCLNGYFLSLSGVSLAETLLDHNNGGAVAAWASTGLTTPDVQEVMARRFYKKIGEGSIASQRLGDYVRDAKGVILGGTDVRHSWALLGDPMLKIR